MTLPLSPDELLTTTRTVRKRLDFDRPVERRLIEECIDIALQAPTGSVKQNWQWIAVSDASTKQALAQIYRDSYRQSAGGRARTTLEFPQDDVRAVRLARVLESSEHLVENMARAPWLVIVAGTGRVLDMPTVPEQSSFWGSVLPAMWSFMLAARARGLGCAWTTAHLKQEEKVARLLDIPFPEVTQCGMFPVAYSIGTSFRRAARIAAAEVTHWDRW